MPGRRSGEGPRSGGWPDLAEVKPGKAPVKMERHDVKKSDGWGNEPKVKRLVADLTDIQFDGIKVT